MNVIDTNIIDNIHFLETEYKLINKNNWQVLDKIYQYIAHTVDKYYVDKFKNLIENEEYDSDSVEYDIPNGNISNCFQVIQNEHVIDAIQRIVIGSHVNNHSKQIYLKYNDGFSIFPGSYEIYLKNEKLFGDKYLLLQQIDEIHFKDCT
eukprot:426458_1